MARSAFGIPKYNGILAVVEDAMVEDQPMAIGDGSDANGHQIVVSGKQALCDDEVIQILAFAPDGIRSTVRSPDERKYRFGVDWQ